jgi:hypothetical protein
VTRFHPLGRAVGEVSPNSAQSDVRRQAGVYNAATGQL